LRPASQPTVPGGRFAEILREAAGGGHDPY
jgi:hypothetical protein